MPYYIWVAIGLVLGIIEMLTLDFFFLTLAIATLGGALASWLSFGMTGQIVAFALTAALLLTLVRPWAKNYLHRSTPKTATNIEALIGNIARVQQEVTDQSGLVKIGGDIWTARTDLPTPLPVDSRCIVLEIVGATAMVAPVENQVSANSLHT